MKPAPLLRPLLFAASLALAVLPQPATAQEPSGAAMRAYAGHYLVPVANASSDLVLLADGFAAARFWEYPPQGSRIGFAGSFSAGPLSATSPGALYVAGTVAGTADVTLVKTGQGLRVELRNASAPTPFPVQHYVKLAVSEALRGLPFAALGGSYRDGEAGPPRRQDASVDAATGAVSGSYAADCRISGRLHGYDGSEAVFRLDASFQGGGCAAQNLPTGSGQLAGYLRSSHLGHLVLSAFGIIGQHPVSLTLTHSQRLGTY